MPTIHVCPLHLVATEAERLMPSGLVTLLSPSSKLPERPRELEPERHLVRLFHDITGPSQGLIPPSEADVHAVIGFGRTWNRCAPLLIHCFAGISRSTAAAFIIMADLYPRVPEATIAAALRAASPTATPNDLMIGMADDLLGRQGRMIRAIEEIGYGDFASHGRPFELPMPQIERSDN